MERLLLVDDAPFIREVIKHLLQNSSVTVVGEACDGQEAIEMAADLKPDVILMDLAMPRCSGIEATRRILEDMPDVRILACSTEATEDIIFAALEAGCVDFIAKPFSSEELLSALRVPLRKVAYG
jgi:CheY-like chemotaxis protein